MLVIETEKKNQLLDIMFFGGNLVSWKCKKQKFVALSSAKAEFKVIAKGITKVLWLRKLLDELAFP